MAKAQLQERKEVLVVNGPRTKSLRYKCTQCEAVDEVAIFDNESFPQTINCWHCHAGYNLPVEQMMMAAKGMFPVEAIDMRGNKKERLN